MSGDTCSLPAVLDRICVRVKANANGVFILDSNNPQFSDIGCYYENGFRLGVYVPLVQSSSYNQYSLSDFQSSRYQIPNGIQVRDANDPLIYLSQITRGNYNFGLSTNQKIYIGVSCLAGGALITGLVITAIYCCFKFFRKQQQPASNIMTTSGLPLNNPNNVYYSQPQQGQPGYSQPYYPQQGQEQPYYAPPSQQQPIGGYYKPPEGAPPMDYNNQSQYQPQQPAGGYYPPPDQQGYYPPPSPQPPPAFGGGYRSVDEKEEFKTVG